MDLSNCSPATCDSRSFLQKICETRAKSLPSNERNPLCDCLRSGLERTGASRDCHVLTSYRELSIYSSRRCPLGRFLPDLAARDIRAAFFRNRPKMPTTRRERRGVWRTGSGLGSIHVRATKQLGASPIICCLAPDYGATSNGTVDTQFAPSQKASDIVLCTVSADVRSMTEPGRAAYDRPQRSRRW